MTGAILPRVASLAVSLVLVVVLGLPLAAACDTSDQADADAGFVDAGPPTPSCQLAECGRFSQCIEENGTARCSCFTGYQGAKCTDCAASLQDRNGDGVCEPACAAGTCPFRANCDDSTGTIVCRCEPGYVMQGNECVSDGTVPVPPRETTPEPARP